MRTALPRGDRSPAVRYAHRQAYRPRGGDRCRSGDGAIVTAEEHLAAGGMGSQVARVAAQNYPVPVKMVTIEDTYAQSGKPEELLEEYGLTAERIAAPAKEAMRLKK